MLKIGQEVYIRREPYDGEEYYEFNGDDWRHPRYLHYRSYCG